MAGAWRGISRRALAFAAAFIAWAGVAHPTQASLLVYEGFNYSDGTNLSGQGGAPPSSTSFGFANQVNGTSANQVPWFTSATTGSLAPAGFVEVHTAGVTTGVILNDGATANPYTDTFAHLQSSGNFVGTNNGGTGSTSLAAGIADHLSYARALNPSVTATFVNGATTYFSFASARAYNANARAPSFAIGAGLTETKVSSNRGDNVASVNTLVAAGYTTLADGVGTASGGPAENFASREAIVVGAVTDSGNVTGTVDGAAATIGGVSLYRAQYYNTAGTRTFTAGTAGAVGAAAISSTLGSGPLAGDHGLWIQGGKGTAAFSLPFGYSDANTPTLNRPLGDNESHVNITVGQIQWGAGAGGTDLVSFYVFHDQDFLLESAFNAGKLTFDTGAVSNKSTFNMLSVAGGRYFLDEIRIGTTFADVAPDTQAVVAVPAPAALPAGLALLSIVGLRRRR